MDLNHYKSFVQNDLKAEMEVEPQCHESAWIIEKSNFQLVNSILL